MAAKGSIAKENIMKQIFNIFPDSFSPDGKEIRINTEENGQPIQIKITLTAAKTPLPNNSEIEISNENLFFISDEERNDLNKTLEEMGVSF